MVRAECVHVMRGHTTAVNAVAVTDDSCKTVSASSDGTVKVWNTDQNSRLANSLFPQMSFFTYDITT